MVKIHLEPLVLDTFAWLYGVRSFAQTVETAMEAARLRERDALQRTAARENWDDDDYSIATQELDGRFDVVIPHFSRYAVLVLLHSLVETQLHACAHRLHKDHAFKLAIDDIKGSEIERAKVYLTKVAGISVGQDVGWQELMNLQVIRDIIVHRRGAPPGKGKKHHEQLERLKILYKDDLTVKSRLNTGGELQVSAKLCEHFISQIDDFFKRLFKDAGLPDKGVTFG
jgi:hypothetical protein